MKRGVVALVVAALAVGAVVAAGFLSRDGGHGQNGPTPRTPFYNALVEEIVITAAGPKIERLEEPMEIISFPGAVGGRCITVPAGLPGPNRECAERHPPYITPDGELLPAKVAEKRGLSPDSLTPNGLIVYRFEVRKAGRYILWARKNWHCSCSNSFRFRIDDGPGYDFMGDAGTYEHWCWATMSANPVTFKLSAGTHELTILNREDGFMLDQLLLTTDLDPENVPVGIFKEPLAPLASPASVREGGGS